MWYFLFLDRIDMGFSGGCRVGGKCIGEDDEGVYFGKGKV